MLRGTIVVRDPELKVFSSSIFIRSILLDTAGVDIHTHLPPPPAKIFAKGPKRAKMAKLRGNLPLKRKKIVKYYFAGFF